MDAEKAQPQKEEEKREKEEPKVKPPEKEEKPAVEPLEKEKEPAAKPLKKEEKGPSGCPHHFGYLANRPKDDPIPEECLTCSKIMECMLKLSDA